MDDRCRRFTAWYLNLFYTTGLRLWLPALAANAAVNINVSPGQTTLD